MLFVKFKHFCSSSKPRPTQPIQVEFEKPMRPGAINALNLEKYNRMINTAYDFSDNGEKVNNV